MTFIRDSKADYIRDAKIIFVTDVAPRPIASVPTTKRSHLHEDWLMYRPVYTAEEVNAVKIVRQERVTMTDKVASLMVKAARFGFDFVTRYKVSYMLYR